MYREHAESVLRAVALDTGSTELAWDSLHEAFMVIQRKLAGGEAIQNEAGFLLVTARRKALSTKIRHVGERELEETLAGTSDVERAGIAGASLIWEACRKLKPQFRIAVLLHDAEDKSADQIGDYLGTGRDSAVKLVQRGRVQMLARMVELVGKRRECPPGCEERAPMIWSAITNRLDAGARTDLELHLSACSYCRETEDQLRQARSLGVLPLLLPLEEIIRRRDQVLGLVQARLVASRSGMRLLRPAVVALALAILLITGAVRLPSLVFKAPHVKPLQAQNVAALASPSPSPPMSPSVSSTPSEGPSAVPSPASKPPPPDPCPSGALGGFAYVSGGDLMYRSSPFGSPTVLDGSGRVDDLRWTPNGSTLVYKVVNASGSVAGSLHAAHPGGAPFWSFGTDIEGFGISPDGGSIAALAQHHDASGNWDAWTIYTGPLGGTLTAHTVAALVSPGGPGWNETVGAEPYEEANYVPNPGFYWGVFWFGNTIYLADGGEFATFDAAGNETSGGYSPQSAGFRALVAGIGQPAGSAIHFSQRGFSLTSTCAGAPRSIVAPPKFTQSSSNTLMVCDDPINPRGGLAIESFNGGQGGDVYLVNADGSVQQLTSDHHSYLAVWRP